LLNDLASSLGKLRPSFNVFLGFLGCSEISACTILFFFLTLAMGDVFFFQNSPLAVRWRTPPLP
jgi:hypothetical protein